MSLTTDDMVEIQQLFARYSHALDTGNAEVFLSTWIPDGLFEQDGRARRGVEELREMGSRGVAGRQRHFNANLLIEGDGDHARVHSYLYLTRAVKQEPLIGMYDDQLVKVDGRWFFVHREVRGDDRPIYEKYVRPTPNAEQAAP